MRTVSISWLAAGHVRQRVLLKPAGEERYGGEDGLKRLQEDLNNGKVLTTSSRGQLLVFRRR